MEAKSKRVAFLCLGTMGYPMAGHLARAGHRVCVYNRSEARTRAWLEEYADASPAGVASAATPAEASRGADVAFVCTGNDDDLREIVLSSTGALGGLSSGGCLIDHTTASPALAREIFEAAGERGVGFLDAPISGGQVGAETGALTIMVGGDEATYARATPWLDCYAKKHAHMGPSGAGQLTKAVNQICIAGLVQALSEGMRFAQLAGLDAERVIEVISQGAAQSWQMDNRASTMLKGEFDFGFAVDWMRKDLAIALSEAEHIGAELPVTEIVDRFYADVQAAGGNRLDTSSLFTRLA